VTEFSVYFETEEHPAPKNLRKAFVLQRDDNWNDYSSIVRFTLIHVDVDGQQTGVGKIKILHKIPYATKKIIERVTQLPRQFNTLERQDFISLGQSRQYYERLSELLGATEALNFSKVMCDIAAFPALAEPFETSSIFRNALMRENEAQLARRYGKAWMEGDDVSVTSAFDYSVIIGGGEVPTSVSFDFDEKDVIPGRIFCIVGRNATGKTGFMAQLATDLAQLGYSSVKRQEETKKRFPGGRPLFPRVIAVSYSAFDKFTMPEPDPSSTYVYCGIRNQRGGLSSSSLSKAYARNRARIHELDLIDEWVDHIQTVLGSEGLSKKELKVEFQDDQEFEEDQERYSGKLFGRLSSGQAILCHFVTALLAWIQPASLVLFDEPETHLHPNAVASLFLVLTRILKENQSYAVVATHSAIVLQDVPSKRAVQFIRHGTTTTAKPLGMESFGESISELTRHVFETIEVESPYKQTLRRLAKSEGSVAAVLEHFPNGLGLAAEAYLLAQFDQDGQPK
jgi:hypothetical protein